SLAYLTAATHGLEEESENIKAEFNLDSDKIPAVNPNARLLRPAVPVLPNEVNWPLLTVSKSVFEGAVSKGGVSAMDTPHVADGDNEGWGSDADLDDDEFKDTQGDEVVEVGDEGPGWDVDDEDLELPDLEGAPTEAEGEGYFVPPNKGTSQAQVWCNNSRLPVDNVLGGAFESAMRLLHDQLGVVDFAPYKSLFLSTFSRSRVAYTGLPGLPTMFAFPHRNW
ncbi:coatomer subunit alpha, partial [Paramuricea clavata]